MEIRFMFNIFWIVFKVVTTQDSNANPSLTASPAIVREGNIQTLTCKYSGSQNVTDIIWNVNSIATGVFTVSGVSCQILLTPDTTLYSHSCDVSNKTFILTIKNVMRSNRNDQWRCQVKVPDTSNFLGSNVVTPKVKVPITSVSMISPKTSTVTVQENTQQQFRCVTSGGLPEPTVKWYKNTSVTGNDDEITSSIVASYSNTTDGLVVTTSSLTFAPTKNDNEIGVYCSAFTADQTPILSTSTPKLNVLYGPDGAPLIQGFTDGASYRVLENTEGRLTCLIRGGNPLPTLTWNCYRTGTFDITDADTVSKTARWIAGRGQDRLCVCYSTHVGGNGSVTIQVQILYPPTTPVFYIHSTEVSGTVKVIRNNSLVITCNSSGKPNQIQYTWTHNTALSSGSVLNLNSVQNDGQYLCNVQNSMDPSDGDAVPGRNSSSVYIGILYPPSTPTFRYWNASGKVIEGRLLKVIQGDTFKVACLSDGNPDPDFYQWDTRGNNQLLTVSSITADQTDHKYKCTVKNSIRETVSAGTNPTRGSAASILTVHAMYPPSSPSLIYRYGQGSEKVLPGSFRKIEGSSETVTVTCNSNSEPRPTFSWNGTLTSHSAMLTLVNVGRSKAGIYTCNVENEMTRTFGNPEEVVRGKNSGSFSLQILYPPVVGQLLNRSVAEGSSLTVPCPVTVGNPPATTFKWTTSSGSVESRTRNLIIDKVSRNDAKFFYTCEVANEMQQTGKQQSISIPDRKSFHLDVWYGATIQHFYVSGFTGNSNVTVNENGRVHFKCNVDSNPGSDITVQNQSEGKYLTFVANSKSLEYILTATCFDAGFYTCSGSNQYNTELSVKQLRLFVNCSPRQSPFIQLKENVTSVMHNAATLMFTALAHPKPSENDFRWFRWGNTKWIALSNNAAYQIDTGGLQSNLTVKDVNRASYGMYKLTVKNAVGDYEHIFNLLPEDKPEDPADFELVQKLVTETSFTVRWKPGFDNGPDQIFILKYRKMSDQVWTTVSIPNTGKSQMNYTVSGLSSGTNYQIVIYASNKLGNTSESDVIIVRTKGGTTECSCSNDSKTAVIVGVVLGLAVVVLTVYSSYVTLLLKRKNGVEKQTTSSRFTEHAKNMPIYANLAYSPNGSGNEPCKDLSESGVSEYTTLEKHSRDDKATYDVINAQC